MVRELKKIKKGEELLADIESATNSDVLSIEKVRKEEFKNELDVGFFFSVVFDTRKERDEWLLSHGIKLEEDFFVKAKNFLL